jgi:hypothetical protein
MSKSRRANETAETTTSNRCQECGKKAHMEAQCPLAPTDLEPYRQGEELFYLNPWHASHEYYDYIVAGTPISVPDIAFVLAYELYNGMESTVIPMYADEIYNHDNLPVGVKWWALARHVGTNEFRTTLELEIVQWLESHVHNLHEDEVVSACQELQFLTDIIS